MFENLSLGDRPPGPSAFRFASANDVVRYGERRRFRFPQLNHWLPATASRPLATALAPGCPWGQAWIPATTTPAAGHRLPPAEC